MKSPIRNQLTAAVLSVAAALGAAGPARAGYVVIVADPVYGAPYPNLGWRAAGALFIPDACLASVGTGTVSYSLFAPSNPACAGIRLQDVKIHFYNTANPGTTVEILNVGTYLADSGSPNITDEVSQEVLDISFTGGQLSDFHTSFSFAKQANDLLAGAGKDAFSIAWSFDGTRLRDYATVGGGLVSESSSRPDFRPSSVIADADYVPAADEPVVPTAIAEPGGVALALVAGLAAGLARRRARNSVPASKAR